MRYKTITFPCENPEILKSKARSLATRAETAILLDNNDYHLDKYHKYEMILGFDPVDTIVDHGESSHFSAFDRFKAWRTSQPFCLGYFSYDLKNQLEALNSSNKRLYDAPLLYFFCPGNLIFIKEGKLVIKSVWDPEDLHRQLITAPTNDYTDVEDTELPDISDVTAYPSKPKYMETVDAIRSHIHEGDVYEMNYCRYFEGQLKRLDSLWAINQLFKESKAPFSTYMRWEGIELLCASPERFLAKRQNTLISQPIKGTIKRGLTEEEDKINQAALYNSEKDRAEHIMIVDLVRNDLSRSCAAGSVEVNELFGIYPFKTITQMISTVTGELRPDTDALDALKMCFPMGSMTGAPKIIAMELIDKYETFQRSVFSSSVGYWDEEDDFDFNVVIRSMIIDREALTFFIPVGGAIVYDSLPEDEYQESLLKAKTLLNILNVSSFIN